MRRVFFMAGLALWLCSCSNSGESGTAADSAGNGTIMTDTNNASKNTGTDMSGGVNAGNLNEGDTTGIDLKTDSTGKSGSRRQ